MRAILLCAVLLLSGCGTFAAEAGPAGVDGLTIPTPSADPADFVVVVDNPWLSLTPGSSREYAGSDGATMTLTVEADTVEVAGLTATAVRTDPAGTVDYYAQDRAGNVWWVGREGDWRAGEAGAQAGLAMAGMPRRGDGYRAAYVPGEPSAIASVLDAPDEPGGGAGTVTIQTGAVTDTYERGTGLVERVSGSTRWELR